MKKFLAIFLTLMLILSMGIAAFAEDETDPTQPTATEPQTFDFKKS